MADAVWKYYKQPLAVLHDNDGLSHVVNSRAERVTPYFEDGQEADAVLAELNAALAQPVVDIEALAREIVEGLDVEAELQMSTTDPDQEAPFDYRERIADMIITPILRAHLADSAMREALEAIAKYRPNVVKKVKRAYPDRDIDVVCAVCEALLLIATQALASAGKESLNA